jgi:hypothetical protein
VSEETEAKILQLLDVISVEVLANRGDTAELRAELRSETAELRKEMRAGFTRVDRRLGNLETRVERVETELHSFRGEFERRIAPLER